MGDPADRARHRENRCEHRWRQPQCSEDDARIKIDIGIEPSEGRSCGNSGRMLLPLIPISTVLRLAVALTGGPFA
jgi:hypothetical protein